MQLSWSKELQISWWKKVRLFLKAKPENFMLSSLSILEVHRFSASSFDIYSGKELRRMNNLHVLGNDWLKDTLPFSTQTNLWQQLGINVSDFSYFWQVNVQIYNTFFMLWVQANYITYCLCFAQLLYVCLLSFAM
jgi:hypothetical protein